ncbi:MAG: efflux RND transporter periplasmic adaptor subunit [Candidatus Marinimicrobia bacterium]|nr:efflux RND transporter periplasmic adaptor subunit [Candidatus Neomarinimicrobiota bacterium]MBL7046850.1 efflux RND transporter periplasmic adaptor subunit [Candidatus Neomarinimicrobiota bacterium]
MKNKQTLILIVITIIITYGLTTIWDRYHIKSSQKQNIAIAESEKHNNHDKHVEDHPIVSISPEELEEFDIEIDMAGPGTLVIHRDLTGEIVIDPDRLAHIGPRFPGIVKEVRKQLGDHVNQGEVLAIIESNESLTPYEVRSLIGGTVIEMHLTQGEVVSEADHAFIVADLSEVWVNLSVYQKDLIYIKIGQMAEIDSGQELPPVTGTISYISPILDQHTRTATARVILKNSDGLLRPGLFVTGKVIVENINVDIAIPKTALQSIDDQSSVFIKTQKGFEPKPVHLGKTNEHVVEILSGLKPGQEYISQGGFSLKAQLAKGSFGDGHGH